MDLLPASQLGAGMQRKYLLFSHPLSTSLFRIVIINRFVFFLYIQMIISSADCTHRQQHGCEDPPSIHLAPPVSLPAAPRAPQRSTHWLARLLLLRIDYLSISAVPPLVRVRSNTDAKTRVDTPRAR
jgi:hypothetical protein